MKTIILCGGKGARLGEETNFLPKAMIKIGHRPIIWHILKRYSFNGFNDFILALGEKGELIRDYFIKYDYYTNDVKIDLKNGKIENLTNHLESDWKISLVDTGNFAMSGARIQRCKNYLNDEDVFMVSYSDCLANIDIKDLIDFHIHSKKIATVTGVLPPYREGEFLVEKHLAMGFYENKENKLQMKHYINGGYMVFNKEIFSYLNSFNECRLESDIFPKLIKDKQLAIYPHDKFWRWLDTERDFNYLNDLAEKNKMCWLY
ncbi:glucose-1-phosphate cytidylyltransferase [Candidatus Microgenomates bacterium]|nr:MAG: glucose-1-phosphate cytidylyltransferase [Candidatus Microgenomates bacterium]